MTPDANPGVSIVSLNSNPPANGMAVSLRNVVVLEAFGSTCNSTYPSCRYGNLYVQDKGGGRKSGIHIFCDTNAKTNPCATALRDSIKGFKTGMVLDIDGTWDTGPTFTVSELEIKPTAITDKATTFAPAAVTITPAELDISNASVGDLRNVYVQIMTPLTVSTATAMEFKSTSKCAANGDASAAETNDAQIAAPGIPYRGFEVTSGSNTVAISVLDRDSKACMSDCPGFNCVAPRLVTQGEMFTSVSGLVNLNTFGCPSTGACTIGCTANTACATTAFIFVEPMSPADYVCPNQANCPQ